MSITLTTVERIGSVGADPAAVAGSGFLYTKLVAGEIQLFYRSDLGTVDQITPSSGTPSPWNNTTTAGSITENTLTDKVLIGTIAAVAGRKVIVSDGGGADHGIRAVNAAAADNVLAGFTGGAELMSLTSRDLSIADAGDAAPRAVVAGFGTATFKLGDGTGVSDVSLTRVTGPVRLNVDFGAQFGGDLNRFEAAWFVKTTRTAAGSGDDITLQGSAAVATAAATAFVGGISQIVSGDAAALGAAQIKGTASAVTAGNGASGAGGGAADGGDISLRTGQPGANGGSSGVIFVTDQGDTNGVDVVPPTDQTGRLGTTVLRFLEVNAMTITSNDMCFTDEACPICNRPFEEGEDLVLHVIKVEQGGAFRRRTRTVPMHAGCR